ncbi:MAG: type I-C CRISPR-associated protein Cas5c [Acidobacteriaceae bacterium]
MPESLFRVRICGSLACFSRPEFSTERVSYEIITPSAARGVLEAILWKPAIRWEVRRISVLSPIKWMEFRRNEVNSRVPTRDAGASARTGAPLRDFYADEDRAQRNTVALKDVDYLIEAQMHLTSKAGAEENITKFREMFERRLKKGQQHYQPYLGCREFPANVELVESDAIPKPLPESLEGERDLGWMLHDLEFGPSVHARFFQARMVAGVVDVPEWTALGGAA